MKDGLFNDLQCILTLTTPKYQIPQQRRVIDESALFTCLENIDLVQLLQT